MSSKNLLFISHMAPCYNEFFPLIEYCQKNQLLTPVVYFDHPPNHANHQMSQCLSKNIVALNENGNVIIRVDKELSTSRAEVKSRSSMLSGVKGIHRKVLSKLHNPFSDLKYLLSRYITIRKILKNYKPKAIVLGVDMAHLDTSLIVKMAKRKGIPIVTLTWIFASGDDPANVYFNKSVYDEYQGDKFANKILLKLFPKYKYIYRGVVLTRLPAMQAFVREMLGLGVPKPWVMNSGYCDTVLVDSEAMLDFYKRAGLPEKQLKNLGSPLQDAISRQLQNKKKLKVGLYHEYCLDDSKPLLVTAIIPNCFDMLRGQTEDLEFDSYEDLLIFWIDNIKKLQKNFNIIATIHPGEDQETRNQLEKQYGIKIIKDNTGTAEIIPLADFYVTSVSSTIRWAISCSVPVLDYDFYNFDNQLGEADGVIKVKTKNEFENRLKLLLDNSWSGIAKKEVFGDASRFGRLDGEACKRISSHIVELINEEN